MTIGGALDTIDDSKTVSPNDLQVNWITIDLIRKAIAQFKPDKAAGDDAIKPKALKQLPMELLLRLEYIYKACIVLGYTPQQWCLSNVIFIPKVDKDDYANPCAWCLISLM